MKRFVILILALILAISAVSCKSVEKHQVETIKPSIETAPPETAPISTDIGLLNVGGEALYRIVRPDRGSDVEVQIGIDLKKSLKELTGATFELTSDFLMPNESLVK